MDRSLVNGMPAKSLPGWALGVRHRFIHLVGLFALGMIAYDSFTKVASRPEVLDPRVWFTLYVLAAASVMIFVAYGTTLSLQLMTVMVAGVGLLRGSLFFFTDGRLTPLGLNILIALYATFAHRYEREWMGRERC